MPQVEVAFEDDPTAIACEHGHLHDSDPFAAEELLQRLAIQLLRLLGYQIRGAKIAQIRSDVAEGEFPGNVGIGDPSLHVETLNQKTAIIESIHLQQYRPKPEIPWLTRPEPDRDPNESGTFPEWIDSQIQSQRD
jgi:hypothetical protein